MSSRVIVKSLPQKCTEEKLRESFSLCGEVTDVKLMRTKTGRSRRFGFVGFSTAEQAQKSVDYYNKTFMGSSKIEVELAKPYGDETLARPWSKYAKKSSRAGPDGKVSSAEEGAVPEKSRFGKMLEEYEELEDDPGFQEFMDVHKHKVKVKTWADSELVDQDQKGCGTTEEEELEETQDPAMSHTTSDLDYLKTKMVKKGGGFEDNVQSEDDVSDGDHDDDPKADPSPPLATTPYTLKMLGLPFKAGKEEVKTFFHPLELAAVRFTKDSLGRPSGRAYVDFKSERDLRKALKRNKDCILHRYIELFRDDSHQEGTKKKEAEESGEVIKPWHLSGESSEIESITESGRIFVRNLPFSTQEEQLSELFGKYGPLTEVTVPLDRNSHKPTGLAFITFMLPEHAAKAYQELDGQIFQGRLLHLLPAKARQGPGEVTSHQPTSSFKRKKEQKLKTEAASSRNWNTLFLGANAVVDVMAKKYSTEKSAILDPSSGGSAAVRLALGETQIVSETREFLQEHGVNLEVFEQSQPTRSKSVIIVKNLPSGVEEAEITQLFQPFGQLLRVILPPTGISALVEFSESSHAKKAFSKLAYTKFKHLPLYLEWAPLDALQQREKRPKDSSAVGVEAQDEESDDAGTSSVFVKNLNFSTKEAALHKLFSGVGAVKSVSIAMKRNPKDPAMPLSMGYGFVEFEDERTAQNAIKRLQHHTLDEHQLKLKLSHHKTTRTQSGKERKKSMTKQNSSAKMLIRNIPFEASRREVKDLFCTFGAVKTVRLPKKMSVVGGGEHRGFGFVEFVSKEDAKRAFKSLSHSTHLYGRRLVLEWAEEEESLEAIRKRTAQHFHEFKLPGAKRSKESSALLDTLEKDAHS